MKLSITCCALAAVVLGIAAAPAAEFTFPPASNPADFLVMKSGMKYLSVDDQGQLTFRTQAGGGIAIFNPDQKDFITSADEFSLDFRTEGRITFAVFLRAQGEDGEAYMAFLGAAPDKTSILYLCKSKLNASQQPSQTALAFKHSSAYHPGDQYTLRLSLKNEGADKAVFSGELIETQTGQPVIQLTADDTSAPITEPGKVAFRFFADKAQGGGAVQISKIAIAP